MSRNATTYLRHDKFIQHSLKRYFPYPTAYQDLGIPKNHRAQSREWKGFSIPILTEASQLWQGWVQWITGPTCLLRPLVKPQEAQQQHDPSQKEDKKEAEQPQNLLGIHQLECHGDHALRWFLPFGHDLIE